MESEMYETYVKQIQRYPLLNFDEEIQLANRVKAGEQSAKIRLVQCNLRLVVNIAKKITTTRVSIMDLIQEGNLGLMTAASKYVASYRTRFSTYAYSWIMQYMLRYLHNRCDMISIPHRKNEMIRRVSSARNFLFQQLGRNPSDKELSVYLGITICELKQTLEYSYAVSSIDIDCGEESNTTVSDMIEDKAFAPENKLMKDIFTGEIQKLLVMLPKKERLVIYYRFNFAGEQKPKTLREISTILGVSTETVRQMEIRAIKHMKEIVGKNSLAFVTEN